MEALLKKLQVQGNNTYQLQQLLSLYVYKKFEL